MSYLCHPQKAPTKYFLIFVLKKKERQPLFSHKLLGKILFSMSYQPKDLSTWNISQRHLKLKHPYVLLGKALL
jgi:hypothetical protein